MSHDLVVCANFHCAAKLLSDVLDNEEEPWEHGLSEFANDMGKMNKITSEWIVDNWQNEDFVRFVFLNALQMSQTFMHHVDNIKKK